MVSPKSYHYLKAISCTILVVAGRWEQAQQDDNLKLPARRATEHVRHRRLDHYHDRLKLELAHPRICELSSCMSRISCASQSNPSYKPSP